MNASLRPRGLIKVGLLGAGYILESHVKALKALPNVTVHAVCDVSRGRALQAAARFAIPHVYSSIDELSLSECDVVHVLLPPSLHIDAAMRLVGAGKSVFLEKPMGLDSSECANLGRLAAEKSLTVGVNHNFLFAPAYERLRGRVKRGELGRVDHLSVCWHFALPFLKFGPFDNWMLAAPSNTLFETGPHLAAFIVDLLGAPEIMSAVATDPIGLPAGQVVYRHWTAVGKAANASVLFSISMNPGQADRYLRIRGRGGSAQLDFGRDITWFEGTSSDNPIFDAYNTAQSISRTVGTEARTNRWRRLRAALGKRPDANPFEESIFRSIRAFYAGGVERVDPRHAANFGVAVMRVCEAIATAAATGAPSRSSVQVPASTAPQDCDVLVVGGTGFIGRRLVRSLISRGAKVRVVTRNRRAAGIELSGLPVDIVAGSHGDRVFIAQALRGISVVYHLAKCEGKNWQDYVRGDIEPTRTLAEAAADAGVRRFIYTGTIASYASGKPGTVIDNATPVDPAIERRSHYPRSKAACEALLQELSRSRGLPVVIARPGIVVGVGSPPAHLGVGRFSSETRVDYWGSGESKLPLVLVEDVADALALAWDAPGIDGQTLLLTSPPLLSAQEYVQAVAQSMGAEIDARPRPAWRYWVSDLIKEAAKNAVRHPNRRWPTLHDWQCQSHSARFDAAMSEQLLGWRPVADRQAMIDRGIGAAVAWYLQ